MRAFDKIREQLVNRRFKIKEIFQFFLSHRSPYESMADDEASRQLSSSATSGRPGSSLLVDSPEVSISPIHVSFGFYYDM